MLHSALNRLINILETAASLVLAAMMLLTFADVIGRYILREPIFGATEMISTMLALLIFLGLGVANARDKHIVVELFDTAIRKRAPRLYDIFVQGFSLCAMLLLVAVLTYQAVEAHHTGAKTLVLQWPLSLVIGAIAALAILSVFCQVLGLFVRSQNGERSKHLGDV